jgi:hypothetical protein
MGCHFHALAEIFTDFFETETHFGQFSGNFAEPRPMRANFHHTTLTFNDSGGILTAKKQNRYLDYNHGGFFAFSAAITE